MARQTTVIDFRRGTSTVVASGLAGKASTWLIYLIMMGTHGRSGMSHVLMGSVAEKVVRAAPCPVMTVRRAPATMVDVPKDLLREWVQAGG
jgi:hypothetical protein